MDLRTDLAGFSRRVLGRELREHQLEAARSEAFVTTIAAARRTGKTVLAETLAIHTAFSHSGSRVLVLSATQDAARRLTESIGGTLNASKLTRGAVVDDFATRIGLANGSEIISLPASQRQVRGYGAGVLLVILYEAGFMPSELWQAVHYVALDERRNGSRLLLLGSPWGGREHFFRARLRGRRGRRPGPRELQWTYEAHPLLDASYLERQRDRVSPAEYAAEVRGEWSDAAGWLFPRDCLSATPLISTYQPSRPCTARPNRCWASTGAFPLTGAPPSPSVACRSRSSIPVDHRARRSVSPPLRLGPKARVWPRW
jgi:hypothetical protein